MMKRYLKGFFKHLFDPSVSAFTLIDDCSNIDVRSKVCSRTKVVNTNLGRYSYIGPYSSVLYAEIGKFCSIGLHCEIGLASHTINYISSSPVFNEKRNTLHKSWAKDDVFEPYKKLIIGNDVWIGNRVMIMSGITIGNGAVIGAGSVVTKDVPPYAIVGGVPARVIKTRFSPDVINCLEKIKWWNLPDEEIIKYVDLFHLPNPTLEDIIKFFPQSQ